MLQLIFIFPLFSNSLAYITIPKSDRANVAINIVYKKKNSCRKIKINWDKKINYK